ncbi:MAG: hypothetical protein FWD60_13820 [Candidatus Azobacteroides sp.]|nr:hypothetical protein [Candidatus Azobacteroides sp.]
MDELIISRIEMIRLLSEAVLIGMQKEKESSGKKPKYVSQNTANKMFMRSRVKNWVNDGLISGKPNGNGKTSTVYFEYSKLMELDASDRIVIRKPYNV